MGCVSVSTWESQVAFDFQKHSSNLAPRALELQRATPTECCKNHFFYETVFGNFKNAVNYNVFGIFEYGFVKKHWFLQHSVGVALCSSRALGAKFDECFGKSKAT